MKSAGVPAAASHDAETDNERRVNTARWESLGKKIRKGSRIPDGTLKPSVLKGLIY